MKPFKSLISNILLINEIKNHNIRISKSTVSLLRFKSARQYVVKYRKTIIIADPNASKYLSTPCKELIDGP